MSKATVHTIKSYNPREWEGKFFHEFMCDGTVDGNEQTFNVSIFSPKKDKPDFPTDTEIELEFTKEFKGVKQYKYRPAKAGGFGGGGGGGFKSAPRNDNAIAAMSALKAAIEYAGNNPQHEATPEDVKMIANTFLQWIKSNS